MHRGEKLFGHSTLFFFLNINLKYNFFHNSLRQLAYKTIALVPHSRLFFHPQYPCFARGEVRKSKWFYAQIHENKNFKASYDPAETY